MYIKASHDEYDLSISALYNKNQLHSAIKQIALKILNDILRHHDFTLEDLEHIPMDLNLVFNNQNISSKLDARRLNFIINNIEDVLKEINDDKKINIVGCDHIIYNLMLIKTVPNSKVYLLAKSDGEHYTPWDELIEWVEDQDPSEKEGN